MLGSDLCDCSYAYIAVKGRTSVTCTNNENRINEKLTFKNNAPFRSCISKVNSTLIENWNLDIFMPMVTIFLWHQEICGVVTEVT